MAITITITVQETEADIQTEVGARRENFTEKEMAHSAAILELIENAFKANGGKKDVILGGNTHVH